MKRTYKSLLVLFLCVSYSVKGQTFSFDPGNTYITENDTTEYGQVSSDFGIITNLTDSPVSIQIDGINNFPDEWFTQACFDFDGDGELELCYPPDGPGTWQFSAEITAEGSIGFAIHYLPFDLSPGAGTVTLSVFDVNNPDYTAIVDYNLSIEMDPTTFLFEHGETSAEVELNTYTQFDGVVTNTTNDPLTVAAVRAHNDIPEGWASMLCFGALCYPPYVDSVTVDIVGIDYNQQVQTIFNQNCTGCHDSSSPAGGLNLLSYENLMSNNVIVPGDHEASELYDRITRPESQNGDMPPAGSLNQDEIDLIADWIDEGALNEEKTVSFSLDVVVPDTDGIGSIQVALFDVALPGEFEGVNYTITTASAGMTLAVSYLEGWNMVGLPLVVEDASVINIFPGAVDGTLYSYDGSYSLNESLAHGSGYWLRFDDSGSTDIIGAEIASLTVSLNEGWNLISGISSTIGIENIEDTWEIIIEGTLYGYNGSYVNSQNLVPGEGYWIRTNDEGEITLSSSQGSAKAVSIVPGLDQSNTLKFSNGVHNNVLYFGEDISEEVRASYSLPPVFPRMTFDARFSDDMKLSMDGGEIQVINTISALNIQYEIKSNMAEQEEWVLTTESGDEYILTGTDEIDLDQGTASMTLAKRAIIPAIYALHQNYPNPFNPVTTLNYDLPKDSHVTLTIYDLSGREINRLVNENQSAGHRSVQWNATDLYGKPVSAGVYLYQIEIEKFIESRKMILLK